jgi:hypothetical protein
MLCRRCDVRNDFLIYTQGSGKNIDMKIADFGLSALVRLDEDGYDLEESNKRKSYTSLVDVSNVWQGCYSNCAAAVYGWLCLEVRNKLRTLCYCSSGLVTVVRKDCSID